MKYLFITLVALTAGIWGYNIGSIATVLSNDNQIISKEYKESQCNDLTRYEDGSMVCKIKVQPATTDLKIFTTHNPQQTIDGAALQGGM